MTDRELLRQAQDHARQTASELSEGLRDLEHCPGSLAVSGRATGAGLLAEALAAIERTMVALDSNLRIMDAHHDSTDRSP